MKKMLFVLVSLSLLLSVFSGCDGIYTAPGGEPQSPLLAKKDGIINIGVCSYPQGRNYSFTGDDAQAIVDYLSGLNLTSDFAENPDEYGGGGWEVSIEYENGDIATVYHSGNMFIKTDSGPWYKMNYDEASRFDSILYELSNPIGALFPPKDITLTPEGMTEVVHHEAVGRKPEDGVPGFVMYIDTERYYAVEEGGVYYIRQIPTEYDRESIRKQNSALLKDLSPAEQEAFIDKRIQELKDFYASLPPIEIEIREVPDKDFKSYAEEFRNQMVGSWYRVDDIQWIDQPAGYYFHLSGEVKWDAPHESHYFIDNGRQGTFHIISRYYMEAGSGAGYRFAVMIDTFTVLNN